MRSAHLGRVAPIEEVMKRWSECAAERKAEAEARIAAEQQEIESRIATLRDAVKACASNPGLQKRLGEMLELEEAWYVP
jgi:hypothetical protein